MDMLLSITVSGAVSGCFACYLSLAAHHAHLRRANLLRRLYA